ncbi:Baculoviral IAP repeat-containing protein 6 [Desmophyllum pertusum]|uniref:Baculoviral IAP repeat-containing protein 6 n=1 Tax=Desmophyllum pertusum TaxID=174260 RepID=A0A9W9YN68_9CNID|nr:Baculoviral IAP repeat-containing protein 6 [Desmophyllum pertusum]
MAAEEEWYFEEEGCLQFSGRPISVTFSPTSNCFICTLEDGTIEVVDARSSLCLKRTSPAENSGPLQCKFCPEVEKLFITNGYVSGLRKDLNGVLLLDTILQPPLMFEVPRSDPVVLELTLSDALQLVSAMEVCISAAEEGIRVKCMKVVQSMLKEEVDKSQWCTCQLKYACSALDVAFSDLVTYLQRSCKNHAALPVVSAMRSRTMYLLEYVTAESKPSMPGNKLAMFMEAVRRKTFLSWPHKEYRWAYPEAMAKAGFYHQPSKPWR